jgi:ribose/xylose/arabinose/galactoside ABC-type transport system permease subunit
LLAALAGVALLMRLHAALPTAQSTSLMALAAVLLGGTSVFGRRAGVAGTALAVMIIEAVVSLFAFHGLSSWVTSLFVGVMIVLGLAVSRGIEGVTDLLNRPRHTAIGPMPS